MYRATLERLIYTGLVAIVIWLAAITEVPQMTFVLIACVSCLFLCARLYKMDYLHPSLVYVIPWLMILIFSIIPISEHARPIESVTYQVLLGNIFAWMFSCTSATPNVASSQFGRVEPVSHAFLTELRPGSGGTVTASFIVLYAFAAINILLAGYVPLLSLALTGDSRYADFGVPSVFGAFLAYANALGCVVFYLYIRGGSRRYLLLFLSILAMHLAFVTRQNLATLLIEAFVIRSLTAKRFSRFTMVWSITLALLAFSTLGTLRSGDIKEVIGVQPEYSWIPTSLIWVYAYSYFNALNIDNTIAISGAPFFDGYMWQTLLPSVLRPDADHGPFLEISSMNVSSYVFPVYIDIGKGVILWTFLLGLVTSAAYRRALMRRRFVDVCTYACLFFCAFLSFFVDFWLYLPVIFQLFFFRVFHILLFKRKAKSLLSWHKPSAMISID